MNLWPRSVMTTLYHSADESTEHPCVVKLTADELTALRASASAVKEQQAKLSL